MSTPLSSVKDIQEAVLELPLEERREIATALLWSLPRDEVIRLHGQLSQMMQKDIIKLLPPEISTRILGYLSPDDLLRCKSVSRDWARLCDDQSIWLNLCRTHDPPIAAAHTTWPDLTVHRQILQAAARTRPTADESFEYNSDDDSDTSLQSLSPTMPSGPATPSPNSLGTSGGPPGAAGLRRRVVWERPQGGLPTYQRATAAPSPAPLAIPDPANDPPILSHVPLPSALPKVNYKHLYLVRRILNRRMTDSRPIDLESTRTGRRTGSWNPRVTILTSGSSTAAGGLPGHVESIYSLHLFQHHMRIPLSTTEADELVYTMRSWTTSASTDIFGTPVSTSWPGNMARSPPPQPTPPIVSGRDWLLTGSRDRTLRLWQMGCANPRVVKVFSGGHTGSILCHFVVEIPVIEAAGSSSNTPLRARSPAKSTGVGTPARDGGPRKRLVAVSGASDGRICLWDIENGDGTPEHIIDAHTDSVLFVRGDDEHIVSCSKDRTIRLFDIKTLEQLLVIQQPADSGHRGAINAVGLTKDFIVSASGDRSLRVWDIRDGRMLATIDAHVRGISCMSFEATPTEASGWIPEISGSVLRGTVVTGSSDMSIKTFYIVQVPPGTALLNELSFRDMLDLEHDLSLDSDMEDGDESNPSSSTRPRLAIQTGVEYQATCSCPMPSARQSPSGCMRCLNRGHTDLVRSLFIGEQATLSASYDSTIKMWNRRTGRLIFDFEGCHSGRVFAITGDRVRVVSSGLDARIAVVDFSDGLDTSFV